MRKVRQRGCWPQPNMARTSPRALISPRSGRQNVAHGVSRGDGPHSIWASPARGDIRPALPMLPGGLCRPCRGSRNLIGCILPHGCRRGPHYIGPDGPTSRSKKSLRREKKWTASPTGRRQSCARLFGRGWRSAASSFEDFHPQRPGGGGL
jgi:hypothetical protein